MIQIPLTKGYVAVIDVGDAHLAEVKWHAKVKKSGAVYAQRTAPRENGRKRTIFLHREVLGLQAGDRQIVDHKNGNGLDCRRNNLRVVTHRENTNNVAGAYNSGSSGFLGVYRNRSRWRAVLMVDGRCKSFGTFSTAEEANLARLKAEMELWGVQPRRRAAFQEAGFLTKGGA